MACLADAKNLELVKPVMEMASDFKSCLQDLAPRLEKEEIKECNCLEVEYFIIRTALVSFFFFFSPSCS